MSLHVGQDLTCVVGGAAQLETALGLGDGAAIAACGAMLQECGVSCDTASFHVADGLQHGVMIDQSARDLGASMTM